MIDCKVSFIHSNVDPSIHYKIFNFSRIQKNLKIFDRSPHLSENIIKMLLCDIARFNSGELQGIINSNTAKLGIETIERSIVCLTSNSVDGVKKIIEEIEDKVKDLFQQIEIDEFIENSEIIDEKEIVKMGIRVQDYLESLSSDEQSGFDCHCFAKFYLGDYIAKVEAFSQNIKITNCSAVEKAKKGDYIFFFKEDKFMHSGVMLDDLTVLSKWGVDGYVVKHTIEQTPPLYGDKYIFARPDSYEGFEKKIRERIHYVWENFMNSPYTSEGLRKVVLDEMNPENEIDRVLIEKLRNLALRDENRLSSLFNMGLIISKHFKKD